jgi:dTDP-4-amino-4,6-dideoxygalactose transaminase
VHAAIGRVQLRKLPAAVRRRRSLARRIAEQCRQRLQTVRLKEALPGCEGAYWFLLLELDCQRLRADKQTFVNALAAEGIPVGADYLHAPPLAEWFRRRAVFGASGYPWASSRYRGDPDRQYDVPNAVAANARHFHMMFHENCGEREADDAVAALVKVERAYLRDNRHDH